jgi:poly(A) polymerase
VNTVSAERIGMEIRRMLLDANRSTALDLLRDAKLLPHVLPEIAHVSTETFQEAKRILSALNEPTISLALAALLCAENEVPSDGEPIGPPPTDSPNMEIVVGVRAYLYIKGSWQLAPENAQRMARRLRFTNKEGERAAWLLANRFTIAEAATLPWPRLQRLLTHDGVRELVALHEAIAGSADSALAYCRDRLAWPSQKLNPAPLLDGGDLINHGLRPGPHFSALLDAVRDAQLNGDINSRDQALALVDRLL